MPSWSIFKPFTGLGSVVRFDGLDSRVILTGLASLEDFGALVLTKDVCSGLASRGESSSMQLLKVRSMHESCCSNAPLVAVIGTAATWFAGITLARGPGEEARPEYVDWPGQAACVTLVGARSLETLPILTGLTSLAVLGVNDLASLCAVAIFSRLIGLAHLVDNTGTGKPFSAATPAVDESICLAGTVTELVPPFFAGTVKEPLALPNDGTVREDPLAVPNAGTVTELPNVCCAATVTEVPKLAVARCAGIVTEVP